MVDWIKTKDKVINPKCSTWNAKFVPLVYHAQMFHFHPLPATLIDKNRKELEREYDKK
jgi:hypothetical protein